MMKNSFLKRSLFCSLLVLSFSGHAFAQRCDFDAEAIFKLRKADIGAYAIWDGVHGDEDSDEGYVGGVINDAGNTVVVGRRAFFGKLNPVLILSEVDRRGRSLWETKRSVRGLDRVLGIVQSGDSFVVSAVVTDVARQSAVWIGFFDAKGTFKNERIIRNDKGGSLVSADVLPVTSGKGFVMVAGARNKQSDASRFSIFYRLNGRADVVSKRAYNPGPDNVLNSLIALKGGAYLAVGAVDNALGRKNGWVLKLDDKGGIIWQREYPRGVGASLMMAAEMDDNSLVVVGDALPALEDGAKAGWVMHIDASNGEVLWQRYMTGSLDYSGKDVLISKDGLISVLLDAFPLKNAKLSDEADQSDYVRLVTLNPRGVIFDSQAFFQGEAADAYQMILGPARGRIIIGQTRIAHQMDNNQQGMNMAMKAEKQPPVPMVKRSLAGWILAAPAASLYDDPCKPKPLRVLE